MKKVYTLVLFLMGAIMAFAQPNQGISGCNDPAGGIQIIMDLSKNCPTAPGSLAGLAEIGFHSGMNTWMNVVDFNAPTAAKGVNNGSNIFTVYIADPDAYYSVPAGTVTLFNFVFNQGITNPLAPWDSEGKDKDNDSSGSCDDYYLNRSAITTTCATSASTRDLLLDLDFQVSPNPFTDRAIVNFSNPGSDKYVVTLSDLAGKAIRTVQNFDGDRFELLREGLSAGMYFLTFQDENGRFASTKVVVK